MILVEAVVGNIGESPCCEQFAGYSVDPLALDQWEAQKNRLRKETERGVELAIALPRNTRLRDGDVLWIDEAAKSVCVARIALKDVMVIDLSQAIGRSRGEIMRNAFELGHALGNQHWPAVVKGDRIYVPLTVDRNVMASVMRTHRFEGISFEFLPGADVIPFLGPHEARRLFGGADATPHAHVNDVLAQPARHYRHAASPPFSGVSRIIEDRAGDASPTHEHEHHHQHRHEDGTEHAHVHAHVHRHQAATTDAHRHAELHGSFTPHRHDH